MATRICKIIGTDALEPMTAEGWKFEAISADFKRCVVSALVEIGIPTDASAAPPADPAPPAPYHIAPPGPEPEPHVPVPPAAPVGAAPAGPYPIATDTPDPSVSYPVAPPAPEPGPHVPVPPVPLEPVADPAAEVAPVRRRRKKAGDNG